MMPPLSFSLGVIRLEKTVLQIKGLENIFLRGVGRWLPSGLGSSLRRRTMLFPFLDAMCPSISPVLKVCVQPNRTKRTKSFFSR